MWDNSLYNYMTLPPMQQQYPYAFNQPLQPTAQSLAQFNGQGANMYAPQSNPYGDASPMSGGVSGLSAMLQNEQMMQGIAALGAKMAARKQPAAAVPPVMAAPMFNGTPFTPHF